MSGARRPRLRRKAAAAEAAPPARARGARGQRNGDCSGSRVRAAVPPHPRPPAGSAAIARHPSPCSSCPAPPLQLHILRLSSPLQQEPLTSRTARLRSGRALRRRGPSRDPSAPSDWCKSEWGAVHVAKV